MTVKQKIAVTRKTVSEIRGIVRNSVAVLSRDAQDPDRIRSTFLSHYIHSLVGSIHKGFMAKSKPGQTDELGIRWKRLKPATIAAKLKKRASVRKQIAASLARTTRLPVREQHLKALQLSAQLVPIGIDDGDLEKSFRQGRLTNDHYHPPTDTQVVTFTPDGVTLESTVPHAKHFHRKRPIYPGPRTMRPWTLRALQAGRDGLANYLQRKLSR